MSDIGLSLIAESRHYVEYRIERFTDVQYPVFAEFHQASRVESREEIRTARTE
jgi:hypothetical protein